MSYKQLFSITVGNTYFPDLLASGFELFPTSETEQTLRNYRLFLKASPNGLEVFMKVNQAGKNPLFPMAKDTVFSFWMKLNNTSIPLYTDFFETYAKRVVQNPVFTNEVTRTGILPSNKTPIIILGVKELELFHQDYFKIWETTPSDASSLPFILHHNPRPPIAELFVYLPNGQSTIAAILAAWAEVSDRKGFRLISIGEESAENIIGYDYRTLVMPDQYWFVADPDLDLTIHFSKAQNTFLKISNTDHQQGELKIRFQGAEKVESDPGVQNFLGRFIAFFEASEDGRQLDIYLREGKSAAGEVLRPISVEQIERAWLEWVDRGWGHLGENHAHGFHLALGSGAPESQRLIELDSITHPITFTIRQEVLPEINLYGETSGQLRILYDGPLADSRVKFLSIAADQAIEFEARDDQNIFEIIGPPELEFLSFNRNANVVNIHPHQQIGKEFYLKYPAKPEFPWGTFGKVELHVNQHFNNEVPEQGVANQFFIEFLANKYHWVILLLVNEEGDFFVEDNRPIEEADKISFHEYTITHDSVVSNRSRSDEAHFIERVGTRYGLAGNILTTTMSNEDLSVLWNDIWDMIDEERLRVGEPEGTRRFLFVSKNEQLTNQQTRVKNLCLVQEERLTDEADEEVIKRTVRIPHLAPPERLKKWIQVIDLRKVQSSPQATTIKSAISG